MMRVAFSLWAGREWFGGYNYLRNLVRVLRSYEAERVEPVLFVGTDIQDEDLVQLRDAGATIVVDRSFDRHLRGRRLVRALLSGSDRVAERIFAANRIGVVFEHAMFYGRRFPIPAIAWLGDFQHRNLPSMFSRRAYWRRELGMRIQISSGRTLMVSSETARNECMRYFGVDQARIHVVRFAVKIDPSALRQDPRPAADRYGLPDTYFLVANQFWKHKNYRIVLDALTRSAGGDAVVASTGYQHDPRHPQHFSELMEFSRSHGLVGRFRPLGVIPYPEVIALMRAAKAVVNPSLSEGWSTIVEEARTLGVPLILSDIPVHREQMGSEARFFDPHSADALADALADRIDGSQSQSPLGSANLETDTSERLARFASDFVSVAEAARSRSGHAPTRPATMPAARNS